MFLQINADIVTHRPNIASFWMVTLDGAKRKQLLAPLKDSVKTLLQTYCRAPVLESIKLHQVLNRLFSYLLSRGGKGLWSAFVPLQWVLHVYHTVIAMASCNMYMYSFQLFRKSWEADFREKSEALSMTEIVCCRRLVELCQSTLIAGYYYHHYKPSQSKHR